MLSSLLNLTAFEPFSVPLADLLMEKLTLQPSLYISFPYVSERKLKLAEVCLKNCSVNVDCRRQVLVPVSACVLEGFHVPVVSSL